MRLFLPPSFSLPRPFSPTSSRTRPQPERADRRRHTCVKLPRDAFIRRQRLPGFQRGRFHWRRTSRTRRHRDRRRRPGLGRQFSRQQHQRIRRKRRRAVTRIRLCRRRTAAALWHCGRCLRQPVGRQLRRRQSHRIPRHCRAGSDAENGVASRDVAASNLSDCFEIVIVRSVFRIPCGRCGRRSGSGSARQQSLRLAFSALPGTRLENIAAMNALEQSQSEFGNSAAN